MRRYRICENKAGDFKIQFKVLNMIWWDWKMHYQGNVATFSSLKDAEKFLKKIKMWRRNEKINKVNEKIWTCRGEY